jgi:DNA-binding transcriptional LysR family regulator
VNMNQLRTLIALAQCNSFSLAAEKLFLTQPAVSFQINSLEEHFGARLVDRSGRRIELTEEGRQVLAFAKEALAALARTEYAVNELTRRVRGPLLVGASTIPGEYILPHIIGAFIAKYPDVQISLEIGDSEQITRKILDQCLDIGVVGAVTNKQQLLSDIVLEDELVLIVPGRHRWPSGISVTVQDLKEEDFIFREKGSGTRQVFTERLKERGLDANELNIVMELGSPEAILTAVEAGLGISVVSRWAADKALALGQVRGINIAGVSLKRNLFVIRHRQTLPNRALEEFQSFLSSIRINTLTQIVS